MTQPYFSSYAPSENGDPVPDLYGHVTRPGCGLDTDPEVASSGGSVHRAAEPRRGKTHAAYGRLFFTSVLTFSRV